MDNRTGRENGRLTGRIPQHGQPAQPENAGNPLGTSSSAQSGRSAEDQERTFRRLSRYGQRGGYGSGMFGEGQSGRSPSGSDGGYRDAEYRDSGYREHDQTGHGREGTRYPQNADQSYQGQRGYQDPRGRQDHRGYPDQTIGTDRNRERQWDERAFDTMENEGDISAFRRSTHQGDRHPPGQQNRDQRGKGSWWHRESLTVSDVMTKNVKSVQPEAPVRSIAELMRQEDVGVVPVVRADGRLFGLVTDRDIVVRGLAQGKSVDDCRAQDLATKDLEVASPEDQLSDILDLMGRQQIRRVPVVDEHDTLVGIIALADIANRADQHDDLQQALERISGRRSFWSRIWR